MFTKILVPVDWSAPATSSTTVAATLAAEQHARIVFLHVQEPVVDLGLSGFAPVSTSVVEATDREIAELLERAVAEAASRGVESESRRETGPIPQTILEAAKREGADLIVMGTHGRSGLARAFIGSVTEAVLREATVPVLALHVPPKV
jgi:nucleotide-binding universal stress UspA family protein